MRVLMMVAITASVGLLTTSAHAMSPSDRGETAWPSWTTVIEEAGEPTDDRVRGEAVEGSGSTTNAPLLAPGRYLDTTPAAGAKQYYAVDVPENGGVLVTATGHPDRASGGGNEDLIVEFMTRDGGVCNQFEARLSDTAVSSIVSAGLIFSPYVNSYAGSPCAGASQLLVTVSRRGNAEPYPVELTVWSFPEVREADALPPAEEDEVFGAAVRRATASGDPTEIEGGRSLSDAPAIDPGVYRDAIQPGEQRVYRVRADWGQTPLFTATLGADTNAASVLGNGSLQVRARWASPVRHLIDARANPENGAADSVRYSGDRPATVTAAVPEIRFLNQSSSQSPSIANASLPGYYYLILEAEGRQGAGQLSIPFELSVEVAGDIVGAPDFAGELLGPDDEVAAAEDEAGDGFPWVAVSVLVTGVLLLLVAVTLVVVAARRPAR